MTTVPAPIEKPVLMRTRPRESMNPFRAWAPPQSPLRIEYTRELLRLLLPRDENDDAAGILYGTQASGVVRVTSEEPRPGLEPVGIFAARWRGEVFLTEPDILRLENMDNLNHRDDDVASGGAIALVIAGGYGGFFVREPNGSMQTIQSYQEFPIRALSPKTNRIAKLLKLMSSAANSMLADRHAVKLVDRTSSQDSRSWRVIRIAWEANARSCRTHS